MPIRHCEKGGRPGFQYGDQKCYTYVKGSEASRSKARAKAEKQMRAIKANQ